jgi:hypothetical protein
MKETKQEERIVEEKPKEHERKRLTKKTDLLPNEGIAVPTAVSSACADNCCNSVVSV